MTVRLILLLVVVSCTAQASVCFANPLEDLFEQSEVIVVGRIVWVGPTIDDELAELLLASSQVVRGPIRPGAVRVVYPTRTTYGPTELTGWRVLAFLKQDADSGSLRPIPWMNCSPDDRFGPSPSLTFLVYPDSVDESLLPRTADDNAMQRLIKQLVVLAAQEEPSFIANAGKYLVQLARQQEELPTLRAAYRALMQSKNPSGYKLGLSGLVNVGDFVGLEALDQALRDGRVIDRKGLFWSLRGRFWDPDPRAISLLESWLDPTTPTDQRVAAARALTRVQTATSTVALSRALYDPELEVRWAAVEGMIPFANFGRSGREDPEKDWPFRTRQTHLSSVSTPSLYVDEEATYLGFWKSWWEDNQDAVRALAAQEAAP